MVKKMGKLNKTQEEAVNFKDGACLVLAGAGSGKTRVITERIVKLISDGVSPHNILAITFTNKAAGEMKSRIEEELGSISSDIFIGTFHSFGLKIIRENLEELNLKRNLTIIDTEDQNTIIKKILKDLNKDPKEYPPRYIKNKISFAKNEMLSPEEYSKFMFSPLERTAVEVYKKYDETLKTNNSVDFDDLLLLPVKLFKEKKEVLSSYQEHYKYILVDEYQDTNSVQYELCRLLSKKYNNIFVVGDIDQGIYSFRYANFENVLNFERDYKDVKTIILEQNYRSTKNILNAANSVIKNNKERKEKNLWSENEEGVKVKYLRSYDERHEVSQVIEEIKKLRKEENYKLKDFCVLYRTNAQSRIIEEGFLKENIPYKIVGSYHFYNRREIKDLISYLKLIYNPDDGISLSRAINVPKRGIGAKTLENIINEADIKNISMFEAIDKGKELEFKKLIIELIEDSKKLTLTELIDDVLNKSGMKEALKKEKSLEADIRLENLEEFKSITYAFEEKTGIVSLEEFLESISLVSDAGAYNYTDDAVNLMTIHSAKGLEFPVVFIVGMEENLFPHVNSLNSNSEVEEERRLAYVAITRAKERLYLLNSKRRVLYGRDMVNAPSRFIKEIDDKYLETNKLVDKKVDKNSMYDEENNKDLKPGDTVMHDKYGVGVVITVEKNLANIAFSHNVGVKTLIKNHKSLKKCKMYNK